MAQVFDYERAPPLGNRATLGLIVLQPDETIEYEFRRFLPQDGVTLYVSRIASAPEVTADTLARMESDLPASAALLPRGLDFDAVGYGCTSGASVIGPERVRDLVQHGCATRAVSNPLSALVAACRQLGVKRLAFLSPYVEQVSDHLRRSLHAAGIQTPVFGSFNEAEEIRVARIDPTSIRSAACTLMQGAEADAIFLSCTNLRTLDVIAEIESHTGKPVLTSNQVLAWDLLRRANLHRNCPEFGQIFS